MASSAAAMLAIAAQQIGFREGQDPNGNWNNLNPYGAWYGMNGVAWCDIFVSWCASMSGNGDLIPKSAYVPGRLAWARGKGLTGHYPPAPGDLGIVMETTYAGNGQTTTSAVHIFIVEKYLGNGQVQTIEGNTNDNGSPQGNGVYRLIRQDSPTSTRYIYIRPPYLASTPAPLPSGGADAPPPKPAPAPAPASAPRPNIKVSNLRLGVRSADAAVFNDLLWKHQGPVYKAAHFAMWMAGSKGVYDKASEQVVFDQYAYWHKTDPAHWDDPRTYGRPVTPGPSFIRAIGGNPA